MTDTPQGGPTPDTSDTDFSPLPKGVWENGNKKKPSGYTGATNKTENPEKVVGGSTS